MFEEMPIHVIILLSCVAVSLFLSGISFLFSCYAMIKLIAQEKAVHSITYIDAEQEIRNAKNDYDFPADVDKINEELKDDLFEAEMDKKLDKRIII